MLIDAQLANIVEMLKQGNELLEDLDFTYRVGLPAPAWKKLYGGVQPDKAARAAPPAPVEVQRCAYCKSKVFRPTAHCTFCGAPL